MWPGAASAAQVRKAATPSSDTGRDFSVRIPQNFSKTRVFSRLSTGGDGCFSILSLCSYNAEIEYIGYGVWSAGEDAKQNPETTPTFTMQLRTNMSFAICQFDYSMIRDCYLDSHCRAFHHVLQKIDEGHESDFLRPIDRWCGAKQGSS